MTHKKRHLALGLAASLTAVAGLPGCSTVQEKIQTTAEEHPLIFCGMGSMVTGGAVWAGCHYALKGDTATCVIGAVAAAVADGLNCWWQLKQKIVEDYDDTRKKLQYDDSQGVVVKILEFSATPKIAKPGDEVKIRALFALMSPNPYDEIKFERKITLPGDSKPRTEIITYQPGTWGIDDFPFKVENSSPDGKVELTLEIRLPDQDKFDRHTLCFNVSHSGEPAGTELCAAADSRQSSPPPTNASEFFVTAPGKKDLTLRESPQSKGKAIAQAQSEHKYPVLQTFEAGKQRWYMIQIENGDTGWISSTSGKLEKP